MIHIFLTLIFFINCNKKEKEQALLFSHQIIETYFNKDCKTNYQYWADSVTIMGPFDSKIKFVDRFPSDLEWCEKFNSKIRYNQGYSLAEYLKEYDLRVYSKTEFTNLELMKKNMEDIGISKYLYENQSKFNDNDYYFSGNHLKERNTKDKINHQGNWEFVISKINDRWCIKGTLP